MDVLGGHRGLIPLHLATFYGRRVRSAAHVFNVKRTQLELGELALHPELDNQLTISTILVCFAYYYSQLEIRSVERGICPIATSTINERTLPIIMAGCMAHERDGYISTSGLKSDVTIVFLDPDLLLEARISAIRP